MRNLIIILLDVIITNAAYKNLSSFGEKNSIIKNSQSEISLEPSQLKNDTLKIEVPDTKSISKDIQKVSSSTEKAIERMKNEWSSSPEKIAVTKILSDKIPLKPEIFKTEISKPAPTKPAIINNAIINNDLAKLEVPEIETSKIVKSEKAQSPIQISAKPKVKEEPKSKAKYENLFADDKTGKTASENPEELQLSYLAEPQMKSIQALLQPTNFINPVGGKIVFKPEPPVNYNFTYNNSIAKSKALATPQSYLTRTPIKVIPLNRDAQINRVIAGTKNMKKKTFISSIGKAAADVNQKILNERAAVIYVFKRYEAGNPLTYNEKLWLNKLAVKYKVNGFNIASKQKRDELLSKINTVPESLAVAQAALESGWGSSALAKRGNNYFGQKCFRDNCGHRPANSASSRSSYAVFKSPREAVEGYIHNLNTNNTYKKFRIARQYLGGTASGKELVHYLDGYSALGNQYENKVKELIEYNKLEN